MDPSRDLLWFKLGDAYRLSRSKQTDPDEKKKRYETAVADYQKAIDLRKGSEQPQKEATRTRSWPPITTIWRNAGQGKQNRRCHRRI